MRSSRRLVGFALFVLLAAATGCGAAIVSAPWRQEPCSHERGLTSFAPPEHARCPAVVVCAHDGSCRAVGR